MIKYQFIYFFFVFNRCFSSPNKSCSLSNNTNNMPLFFFSAPDDDIKNLTEGRFRFKLKASEEAENRRRGDWVAGMKVDGRLERHVYGNEKINEKTDRREVTNDVGKAVVRKRGEKKIDRRERWRDSRQRGRSTLSGSSSLRSG